MRPPRRQTKIGLSTEQNRREILFVKTCTYIHHHTKHLIQLYTRDIQGGINNFSTIPTV